MSRSERRKQMESSNKQGSGLGSLTRIWSFIFLLASVAFVGALVFANILAPKFLLIAALVVLLLFVILFPPMFRKKTGGASRGIAFVLSLLLTAAYCFGAWYLTDTMGFMDKITTVGSSEEYNVVVRDDDVYNELQDIAGQTVYAYRSGTNFDDAVTVLTNDVSVTVEENADLAALMENLLTGSVDVIYLNSGIYSSMASEQKDIKDFTKILHTVKVDKEVVDIRKPVDVKSNAFNVYVTGIDTSGTIDVVSRSDVNMILTVNPDTKTILMTSIPRDYYVVLPDVGAYDKLTHTGIHGADYTVSTVENLLGIDINYYVKVNFSTVELLVDAIGGIEVDSDVAFTSKIGGYWFDEGTNYLDGHQALAFARERYAFSDGDFQRNINQQKVMKAIIKKMTTSTALLTNYTSILGAIENNFETNMTSDEIKSLVRIQTEDMSDWNFISQSIKGVTSSEPCYALGNINASVVLQDQDSIDSAIAGIKGVEAGEIVD